MNDENKMTNNSNNTSDKVRYGKIISVRGSVVDVWFDDNLPPVYTLLHTGKDKQIAVEVLTQLDDNTVRGISLNPTQGLARGMLVETTGKELTVPVGKEIIGRMFDVFGNPIDHLPPLPANRRQSNRAESIRRPAGGGRLLTLDGRHMRITDQIAVANYRGYHDA